jgi:hypothetical protein
VRKRSEMSSGWSGTLKLALLRRSSRGCAISPDMSQSLKESVRTVYKKACHGHQLTSRGHSRACASLVASLAEGVGLWNVWARARLEPESRTPFHRGTLSATFRCDATVRRGALAAALHRATPARRSAFVDERRIGAGDEGG